jgi:hypothetical protein
MPSAAATTASAVGSPWAPGGARTSRAPVIKGRNSSQIDASKITGVFCSTRSSALSGNARCIQRSRLAMAR